MASIITFIVNLIVKIFTGVVNEQLKGPAVKQEVKLEEGNLCNPSESDYNGLYGVHDRDKAD